MVETTGTQLDGADTANPTDGVEPPGTGQMFDVEINGETKSVTLEELQAGYLRQADYTRKTTDVANQRKELEPFQEIKRALDENPAVALGILGEHYGVNTAQPVPGESENLWDDSDQGTNVMNEDPRIAQLEQQIQALTTNQAVAELDKRAQALVAKYPDADAEAVKRHAQTNGFPNLEAAYKDLHFETYAEAFQEKQARLQAEQSVVDAKKSANGVVAHGSGTAAGSLGEPPAKHQSLADSLRDALTEAGEYDPTGLDDPAIQAMMSPR